MGRALRDLLERALGPQTIPTTSSWRIAHHLSNRSLVQINNPTTLSKFWGLLKYYHAQVTAGTPFLSFRSSR